MEESLQPFIDIWGRTTVQSMRRDNLCSRALSIFLWPKIALVVERTRLLKRRLTSYFREFVKLLIRSFQYNAEWNSGFPLAAARGSDAAQIFTHEQFSSEMSSAPEGQISMYFSCHLASYGGWPPHPRKFPVVSVLWDFWSCGSQKRQDTGHKNEKLFSSRSCSKS